MLGIFVVFESLIDVELPLNIKIGVSSPDMFKYHRVETYFSRFL